MASNVADFYEKPHEHKPGCSPNIARMCWGRRLLCYTLHHSIRVIGWLCVHILTLLLIWQVLEKFICCRGIYIQRDTHSISEVGIGSLSWLRNEVLEFIYFVDRGDVTSNGFEVLKIFSLVHRKRFLSEISPHHYVGMRDTKWGGKHERGDDSYRWYIYWKILPQMVCFFLIECHKLHNNYRIHERGKGVHIDRRYRRGKKTRTYSPFLHK